MYKDNYITLLTTNSVGFPPFILHRAIKFYTTDGTPYILHQTVTGIEIIEYEKFIKERTIYNERQYPIKYNFDPVSIKAHDKKDFDWMSNNCEDFTSEIIESSCGKQLRPKSPQRTFWMTVFAIILITLVITKRYAKA